MEIFWASNFSFSLAQWARAQESQLLTKSKKTKLRFAQGKQNLRATCPKDELELKFFSSPETNDIILMGSLTMVWFCGLLNGTWRWRMNARMEMGYNKNEFSNTNLGFVDFLQIWKKIVQCLSQCRNYFSPFWIEELVTVLIKYLDKL